MVPPRPGEIQEWHGWVTGRRCSVPGGMTVMVLRAVVMLAVAMIRAVSRGVGCCSPVGKCRGTTEGGS